MYNGDSLKLANDSDNEELFTFDGKIIERAIKDIYKKKGFSGKDIGGKAGKALMFENYRILSNAIDKGIKEAESSISIEVTDELKQALSDNALLFSGFKAYHTMREAGLSLQDKSTGGIKSFDDFKKDAEKVFKRQNLNLRAEYQHATTTAQMVAKWQKIEQDGDRYDLQYRTAGDDKVRAEHSALNGTTLPPGDKFWSEFYPPNGWGCRCQAVQVRKGKYTTSNSDKAIEKGREMTSKPSEKIFRTNAGKTKKVFPDKHPNFPKGCGDCKLKLSLDFKPDRDICSACEIIHKCVEDKQKTAAAIQRMHYLHEMKPLLKKKVIKSVGEKDITIRFTPEGNKHIYADTFVRVKGFDKDKLKKLDEILQNASFVKRADLSKVRKDDKIAFYYFKGKVDEKTVHLNVAEQMSTNAKGKNSKKYTLYALTSGIKK